MKCSNWNIILFNPSFSFFFSYKQLCCNKCDKFIFKNLSVHFSKTCKLAYLAQVTLNTFNMVCVCVWMMQNHTKNQRVDWKKKIFVYFVTYHCHWSKVGKSENARKNKW